eukprot:435073-Pelagomonas_calceolata.AAC.1
MRPSNATSTVFSCTPALDTERQQGTSPSNASKLAKSASDGQLPDKVLKFLTAKQHVEELATVHEVCVVVKPLGPMSIIHVTQLGVAHDLYASAVAAQGDQ